MIRGSTREKTLLSSPIEMKGKVWILRGRIENVYAGASTLGKRLIKMAPAIGARVGANAKKSRLKLDSREAARRDRGVGCSRARIYLGPKEISDDTRADSTLGGRRKVGRDTGTKVSRFVIE